MKRITILLHTAIASIFFSCTGTLPDSEHILHYESPADAWEEMLPVGNGRMGMMTDGDPADEHIILNEISLWSGCEADYANPDAAESLKPIREALMEGRNADAQKIMYERFVPKSDRYNGTYGTYQVLGQLVLKHDYPDSTSVQDYRRWLDLREATTYARYRAGDVSYLKKYYVSRTDDVMIVEITASKPGSINMEIGLDRAGRAEEGITEEGLLKICGSLESGTDLPGMNYCAYARVISDGMTETTEDPYGIKVNDAGKVWIVISSATDYFKEDHEGKAIALLNAMDMKKLKHSHRNSVAAHQELYLRNTLSLGTDIQTAATTDKRVSEYAKGARDNSLAALYYNYGRYLLICSTRPGCLPPNLQGLWANTFHTPWNGDYHTNINVQMNHWIAESGNLSELHEPLIDLTLRLIPSGEKSAKDFYGQDAEGWVQHMMTNVWNYTAPGEHPSWGATNTGGAWLCAHLWEHYLYSGDHDYLRRVYPALKGASEFFLSTMIREPKHGWLVTAPTSSPENSFIVPGDDGDTAVSICMGPTMDNQLIRELFTNTVDAAELLGLDKEFADSLKSAVGQLPPHQISPEGYLMEWLEDYEEAEPQHRHVSHLYGLYPGRQISPSKTPDLAEACKVTLNRRGDEATGWSRAWKMNFWARLGDGDRALKLFRSLLSPASYQGASEEFCNSAGTYPNLLCAHPPFQIDGNFGGAAGISEMLVQSSDGFINILPALPEEWPEGEITGLKVRGGAVIDLKWSEGRPAEMIMTGGWDEHICIRMPNGLQIEKTLPKGRKIRMRFD